MLNWNIRSGGGKRIEKIASTIEAYSPDVVVITEYRKGKSGEHLKNMLSDSGWKHFSIAGCEENKNSSLIATKEKHEQSDLVVSPDLMPYVATAVVSGIHIIAPFCATGKVGEAFITFLSDIGTEKNLRALATGDFFFGPRGSNLKYGRLVSEALTPAWFDLYNGDPKEPVWSFQNSSGGVSRPDHAWVTNNIRTKFSEAYFDLEPLDAGLSDHAPMLFSFGEV